MAIKIQDFMADKTSLNKLIMEGMCPWCGRGPFRNIARHTNHKHQIDRHELKEILGVLDGTPLCCKETRELMRQNGLSRPMAIGCFSRPGHKKVNLNPAFKKVQKAKADASAAATALRIIEHGPNRDHGTRSMYGAGCRCLPCVEAASKYRKDRWANNPVDRQKSLLRHKQWATENRAHLAEYGRIRRAMRVVQ